MSYERLKEEAKAAVKEVAKMGPWDSLQIDKEDGKPVVVAIIRCTSIQKFLFGIGIMKAPVLPEKVHGIKCRLVIASKPKQLKKR